MGSVTSIRRDLSAGRGPAVLAAGPDDLIESADDHTRRLLERRPASRRKRLVPLTLVLADLLCLCLAFALSSVWWRGSSREFALFVLTLPCWLLIAQLHGLYRRDGERPDHRTTDELAAIFHLVTIGAWLLLVVSRLAGWTQPRVLAVAILWLLASCLLPLARALARRLCKLSTAYQQNTVILGAGDIGQLICRKLIKHPDYGANVVGMVDAVPKARRPDLPEHITILGGSDRLPEIVKSLDVERVVVAFSDASVSELLAILREVRSLDIQVDLVPWLFELVGPRASAHMIEELPLIGLPPRRRTTTARALKRTIDIVGSALGLIVLFPLMAYIAVRIRRDSPGPVLVRQTRLGAFMKEFTALEFRTMRVDTNARTGVGRWLRRASLDELPRLINVLKGDMSLVGPRPFLPYEAENLASRHLDRFGVPPGLTGLWQVTARGDSTYLEALDLDGAYVRDWSLGLDLQLLLRTPLRILRRGASTA